MSKGEVSIFLIVIVHILRADSWTILIIKLLCDSETGLLDLWDGKVLRMVPLCMLYPTVMFLLCCKKYNVYKA